MARIDTGNTLETKILQPGWTISDDGFGLHTCSAVRINDRDEGDWLNRGSSFPVEEFNYLKLHKYSISFNALGITSAKCDYVGIDPTTNSGNYTNPQIGNSNGLTTENLTAHPNFYELQGGYSGVIAGNSYSASDLGPTVTLMNLAGQKVSTRSCIGQNGACFERETGGRFIGFVNPSFKSLYGKTSYLAPTTQVSGIMYCIKPTTEGGLPWLFKQTLGKAGSTRNFNGNLPYILPDYMGDTFTGIYGHQLLLSQVNFEDFGNLVKINYEVRISNEGWDSKVYKNLSSST